MMQVLSIQEFKDKFTVDKLTLGKYNSGKYGWEAQTSQGLLLNGPVTNGLVQKLQNKEIDKEGAAFVEYKWDNCGVVLKKNVWVLQIRPSQSHIETLEAQYVLLSQLNAIKKKLYGEKMKPFSLQQLLFHLRNLKQADCYVEFKIPKKNGKTRTISAPNRGLKIFQTCLNLLLQEKYTPTAAAMGFVTGRSVADNARMHTGQNYVFNIDLKDFFPSISSSRVFAKLQKPPYSFDKATASIIADLCCYNGVLPQGAPTSPIITNIICERLDWRLSKLANQYDLRYSRYADDITFSGMTNLFHVDGVFVKDLYHYIEKEGFVVNLQKTRLNSKNYRQEVTGLTVNEKANVSKVYVKTLRSMIHKWEVLGHDEAQKLMAGKYLSDKSKSIKGIPQIENVIGGKLNYMKMIKGGSDTTYRKLNNRYQSLVQQDFGINQVIETWKSDGIDEAVKLFVDKQSWNGLNDKWHGSLHEFEELVGEKVCFVSAHAPKSRPDDSKEAHAAMEIFRKEKTSEETNNSSDKENNEILSGILEKMGVKAYTLYIPTIKNQQYLGKTKLVCAKDFDTNKEVFVSYGGRNGRSVFFFSNTKGYYIEGVFFDEKAFQERLSNLTEGELDNEMKLECLKNILSSNVASPELRKMRTDLIIGEFDAILNALENKSKVLTSLDKNKKHGLLPTLDKTKKDSRLVYHSPQRVVAFLKSFTTEGKTLKYTTHSWDGAMEDSIFRNKDFDAFVLRYKAELDSSTDEMDSLYEIREKYNEPLGRIIYNFLLNEKDSAKKDEKISWGKYDVKVGYCYPKDCVGNWMKSHPNMQPMAMPLSEFPAEYRPSPIEGRELVYFEDVVNVFKEAIEFRGDNLYYMCESLCREIGLRVNREKLKTLKGINFYTDTYAIEKAIIIILRQCKQYQHSLNMEISASVAEDNSNVILEILHIDSFSNKSLNDDKINLKGGQLCDIKWHLRSLCDWSIESNFKDENGELGAWRIDYLYSEDYACKPQKTRIPECAGFKHIMKFYL